MLFSTLKANCMGYFEKELIDSITLGTDLFVVAANNVRKRAEMLHNFESAWCKGTLSVAPTTGGALSAATIFPAGGVFTGVKEIISVAQTQSGSYVPLILRRPNQELAMRTVPRVPTDAQVLSPYCGSYLILRGDTIYKYPDDGTGSAITIYLEMYGWLRDYVTADLSLSSGNIDFFMEHGYEYMQWGIILELNYLYQKFVFRQEGNPGAPEKKLDAAWEALVAWDSYRVTPHISDDR